MASLSLLKEINMDRRQFMAGVAALAIATGCLPLTALAARKATRKIYPDLAPTPLPQGIHNMKILAVKLDKGKVEIKLTVEPPLSIAVMEV